MQLTERRDNHDNLQTPVECATLDRQAHLNLARRRQYRAWVSLYTSYDVFTCIALRHHLREAFTAYTYPSSRSLLPQIFSLGLRPHARDQERR